MEDAYAKWLGAEILFAIVVISALYIICHDLYVNRDKIISVIINYMYSETDDE